ncbi:phosphatidylglycerol lysyltransferase domain-containing protein [Niabella aquatica]
MAAGSNSIQFFLKKITSFSPKTYWREILALVTLLLCYLFFRSERKEIVGLLPHLKEAQPEWAVIGIVVTVIYIFFQSMMYVYSFKTIGSRLYLADAAELFLKRNFLSVFLPAGSISSLAYTPSQLRKRNLSKAHIHQAGGIYAFVGMLTVFIIGIPVILHSISHIHQLHNAWAGLLVIFIILAFVAVIYYSIKNKGFAYRLIVRYFPSSIHFIEEFRSSQFSKTNYFVTILYSLGIELTGVAHVYIAMMAMGCQPSVEAAFMAYTISVLLMIISPFLRGLGAVEFSMIYILHIYGYNKAEGLGITILYRIFEFWLPLLGGIFAFAWRGKQLFIRLIPALAIFGLGIINILSVLTPPIAERIKLMRKHLPLEVIQESKLLVLFVGVGLIITTAYLIRGYRNAFYTAILFCILSLVGNIIKAWDYEEATISFIVLILLFIGRKEYRIQSSIKWMRIGLITVFTVLGMVCLLGIISFYFISKRHFGVDFDWQGSVIHTLKSFFLLYDDSLDPKTHFAKDFLGICRITGMLSWGFLLFALLKPRPIKPLAGDKERNKAASLLKNYSSYANDYFKIYYDKLFFFSSINEGFISYKIASGFAICLDEPVCAPDDKLEVLREFEIFCKQQGLKTIYYRVDENSLPWFNAMGKQKIFIGQEAILEVPKFVLTGRDKSSLRNGLNSLKKKNYVTTIITAPQNDAFVNELKALSDEWLEEFDKEEMVFSQGMFIAEEIKQQDIIVTQDEYGKTKAFLNIIPNFAPDECTYDLIRKTTDAPGGCMDALIVKLIEHAKEKNIQFLNLGLVPLTGNDHPQSPAEQVMRFASEKLKRFRNYHTLRNFKEKYASVWANKYIVYGKDFDLLQLPVILNKIMKP